MELCRADWNAFREIKVAKGLRVNAVKTWVDITIRDLTEIGPQPRLW
jgi:hypothetical protein